jgi:hypothetical protein
VLLVDLLSVKTCDFGIVIGEKYHGFDYATHFFRIGGGEEKAPMDIEINLNIV